MATIAINHTTREKCIGLYMYVCSTQTRCDGFTFLSLSMGHIAGRSLGRARRARGLSGGAQPHARHGGRGGLDWGGSWAALRALEAAVERGLGGLRVRLRRPYGSSSTAS